MTQTASDQPGLSVTGLCYSYGGANVVDDVGFDIPSGTAVGLIGPNGAGKSTLVDCVSGALTGYTGKVALGGVDVTGWPSHRCAAAGLIRTFQTSRVFPTLTTISNLLLGYRGQLGERLLEAVFRRWRPRQAGYMQHASSVLMGYMLADVVSEPAQSLSGGQRRLLELARALALQPHVLILDEPFAGVNPVLRQRLLAELVALRNTRQLTIVMIEHRLDLIEQLCDDVLVMARGRLIGRGSMTTLRTNAAVMEAYLGGVLE